MPPITIPRRTGYSAATRPFGVEIETTIPNRHQNLVPTGYHRSGPIVPLIPDGWEARSDGSIHPDRGYYAAELVSPAMSGEAGLRSVVFVSNWLASLDARPNDSTGLHVHVCADDLDLDQVRAVRRAFIRYENAILALNGDQKPTRLTNQFCALSDHWVDTPMRDVGRYCTLNVINWRDNHRHGGGKTTLECRAWASTNNDARIVAAVSMFVALVQRAAELGARSEPRIEDDRLAVRTFIRQHFGRGIRSTDLRISPSRTIADVMLAAYREATAAAKATAAQAIY